MHESCSPRQLSKPESPTVSIALGAYCSWQRSKCSSVSLSAQDMRVNWGSLTPRLEHEVDENACSRRRYETCFVRALSSLHFLRRSFADFNPEPPTSLVASYISIRRCLTRSSQRFGNFVFPCACIRARHSGSSAKLVGRSFFTRRRTYSSSSVLFQIEKGQASTVHITNRSIL